MKPIRTLCATLLLALIAGCGESGDDETADNASGNAGAATAEVSKADRGERRRADSTVACEALSDAMIRSRLALDEDVALERSPSQYSPHPLCTVSWAKANAAELEQEKGQLMMDYLRRKAQGEDVAMPSFRTSDDVSLTIYTPAFESKVQAIAGFDAAMKRLADGVTATAGGREITFQADVEPVSGVGDKAMWVPKMRQLSFVSGNQLLHLTVNTGSSQSEELATARLLAEDVMAAL